MQRGKIENRGRASRIRDFSGLRYGNITPTDIDGFMDFQNKAFIFFELKYKDKDLPYGQKLALERLVDKSNDSGVESWGIVASHSNELGTDIDAASSKVVLIRRHKEWKQIPSSVTLKEYVDKIYEFLVKNKIINR